MKHQINLFLLLVFIYLVFALPFKAMNIIPGFTDVRPVSALAPIYGIFYGPLGCLPKRFHSCQIIKGPRKVAAKPAMEDQRSASSIMSAIRFPMAQARHPNGP